MMNREHINIDIPTPEELRDSFWKNTIITLIRSAVGALIIRKLIFEGYALEIVSKINSALLLIVVVCLILVALFWSFMAVLELPINIPSYIAQMKKGCLTFPVIRMYLYDFIPLTASSDKLTLSPSERWVVRSATDTVTRHLNTRSKNH